MVIRPSEKPGSCERHLLRKAGNPLFTHLPVELNDESLLEAQRQDQELLEAFLREFRELLHQTTALDATAESEAVLALKDRLDRAYESASAVAGDQVQTCQSIRQLLELIMTAIRKGAGDDVQAQQELEQEAQAREAHFRLLESSLVADLLNPASVIKAQELVPVLLCSDRDDLLLAIQLFDREQLHILFAQSLKAIESLNGSVVLLEKAEQNLRVMDGYIKFVENNLQL